MSRRSDLEDERRFLLDSLRDLEREHDRGEIADDDYRSLHEDYTARAAEVLRALAAARAAREDEDDGGGDRPRPRAQRVVAWAVIAGMVLLAGASFLVLFGGTEPREASGPAAAPAPGSVQDRLERAHRLEGEGQAVEALKLYDSVLREDPDNVEALTYRGWLLKLAGLTDQAQAALDRAVAIDPSYPDAHFFLGMLLYQDRRNPAAAIVELERYLASNPPPGTVSAVQNVLERARRDLATPTPPP